MLSGESSPSRRPDIMKIVMLINGLYPDAIGGIEVLGAELARRLAARHDVVVYTSFQPGLPAEETRDNYRIRRSKSTHDLRLKLPLGFRTINVLNTVRTEKPKPDIILSMSLGRGFISYLASKLSGVPYAAYVLGSDWYIARDRRIGGCSFRTALKNCSAVITQTDIIKSDILKHFPGMPIEVIPNGITLPGKRAAGDKIISLGRLHPVKGINYLIEAVRRIDSCPELVIAGDGSEADSLRRLAQGSNVRFLGRIDDVETLFMQGMMFVLPSLSEGLPQAMLEAMSYGLPVIATKVGGVPAVIEHGKTGFLVEPKNVEELRRYIETLLRDETLRRSMSDNCVAASRRYSWDTILGKIEAVLERSRRH